MTLLACGLFWGKACLAWRMAECVQRVKGQLLLQSQAQRTTDRVRGHRGMRLATAADGPGFRVCNLSADCVGLGDITVLSQYIMPFHLILITINDHCMHFLMLKF